MEWLSSPGPCAIMGSNDTQGGEPMKDKNPWFTVDQVDPDTYIISEYRHWE